MGVVGGCCGATSSEREGDRERAEAPSGAQLRVSIECPERILVGAGQFPIVFGYSFLSDTYPDVS